MLKMVDGTGIIGVDMICPLGGTVSPPQPPNYDKVEVEGVGSLMLPNSLEAPVERVELIGNSVQPTTTGKNLFDIKKASDVSNYITTETLAKIDITAAIVFDVKKNTNYCLSVSGKTDQPSINFNIANDVQRKSIFNKLKTEETLNSLDSGKIYVGFSGGDTELNATKLSQEYFDIQLEEASSKTPYEPYTGGNPSPSPEYPQEIKNSGKWNEETQKYEVDVKITNAEQNWSKEQVLTLTSDRPITKWDRLVEQGGQIGWLYQSKIASLTGKEEWKSGLNAFYTTAYNFMKNNEAKCSHYVLGGITNQEKNNIFSIGDGAYANSLWVRDTSFGTVQDFKAHLSDLIKKGTPITVVSSAAETEFVPLPQSEQNAIRALKTYYPTTVITVDGGELDLDIKVTYRKEI